MCPTLKNVLEDAPASPAPTALSKVLLLWLVQTHTNWPTSSQPQKSLFLKTPYLFLEQNAAVSGTKQVFTISKLEQVYCKI